MTEMKRIKEDILAVLDNTDELLGAREIMRRIKRSRVGKALKELETEGRIEWDDAAHGWKFRGG